MTVASAARPPSRGRPRHSAHSTIGRTAEKIPSSSATSSSRPTTPLARRATRPTGSRPVSGQKVLDPLGPHSHSQRVAELCCLQFRFQQSLGGSKQQPRRKAKAVGTAVNDEIEKVQAAYRSLPLSVRPSTVEVEAEMEDAKMTGYEAMVSLMVGRQACDNLKKALEQFHSHLDFGIVDLKVWVSATRGDLLVASLGSDFAGRVLAALAVLHGAEHISAIDASDLQLEEVPDTLRLFPALRYLNLSRNKPLSNLAGLRACVSLQAIDLSDCPHLEDVRFLGTLPNLEVALLARCAALEDIRPLVLCGSKGVSCDDLELDLLTEYRKREGVHQLWPLTPHIPLGHPSLRWLVLDGCARLHRGIASLRLCQSLTYVDLFGCNKVDAFACHLLERDAAKDRSWQWTLVWPNVDRIHGLAMEQSWPESVLSSALEAARAAAAEKLALARGGFMPPVKAAEGVFRLLRPLERAWRISMASAHRAAEEFGVEFTVPNGTAVLELADATPQ